MSAKRTKEASRSRAKRGHQAVEAPVEMVQVEKFCKYHATTHPADLHHFASNAAAKDGLYYICKVAEKEIRDAKKAANPRTTPNLRETNSQAKPQAATARNVVALPAAATEAPALTPKASKRAKK